MSTPKALNTREAANYLKDKGVPVSDKTMEVWRCQGRGPRYRKVNRWVKYLIPDLDLFAEGQVVETIDSRQA